MRRIYKLGGLALLAMLAFTGCSSVDKKQSDITYTAAVSDSDNEIANLCFVEAKVEPTSKPLVDRPYIANLYFETGTDQFSVESLLESTQIYQNIISLNSYSIILIGHTDTVGSVESNEVLALKRVERVKQDLIDRGVDPIAISIDGQGEAYLNIATEDGVDEPKNRRVEIYVR